MAFNVYGGGNYEEIAQSEEPMLKWLVMAFAACWHVYLMNLMVAQLCQRYGQIFHDARGNARLTRGINIYETSMPLISKKRWTAFVESLHLDSEGLEKLCAGNVSVAWAINRPWLIMPPDSPKNQKRRLWEACELDEGDNGPRGAVPTVEDPNPGRILGICPGLGFL